ncbi:MAG: hypothetical protein H7177_00895 [Rhizobacter sp.]|nr:hypothetical protein [Bacteriovorax sp.]
MDLFTKKIYKLLFFILLVINSISLSVAETKNTIAQFQTLSAQRMTLSFYSNQLYLGEFNAFVTSDGKIQSIDRKSFQKLMEKFLVKEKYDEFVFKYEQLVLLNNEQILDFGLDQHFDSNNFKLDVRAPDSFLNPNHVSITDRTVDQNEVNVYPSFFSSFVNYSFNGRYVKEQIEVDKKSHLSGVLDPVVNIDGNVLESHHTLNENGTWTRSGSKVTKDVIASNLRLSFGDLNYFPRTFQTPYQYLGFSVASAFDISPMNINTPTGEREIFLESPSIVEIFINGFLIQTINLEAGKHVLEEIPVSQGINHVALRITDNAGRIKFVYFKHTGSESMLKKGLSNFSYEVGSISKFQTDKIKYEKDSIASFYHRYGVSNYWTTGINSQLMNKKRILGVENQFGTDRGLFIHNLSLSNINQNGSGVASKFSYIWTCPCGVDDQIKRLTFSYEYQSPKFLSNIVIPTFVQDGLRHNVDMTYNQKLSDSLAGIIQGRLSTLDFKNFMTSQYSAGLNYRIANNLFSNFYWTNTITKNSVSSSKSESILLQLNYNFDSGKKSLNTTFNRTNDLNNIQSEFSYNENKAVNNRIYSARLSGDRNNKNAFVGSYLNTQYNEFSANFAYDNATKRKEININPSGSLTFIDNKFSLGQRIQQSFIVVDNELREPVIINGDQDNHEAYIASNGRTVLTAVQPYMAKSVNVISDDNKSLGLANKEYRVKSHNKSGSYLKLGSVLTKTIEGIFVDETGKPISLAGAKLINLSTGSEIAFFTGRDGAFYVDNVKPDNYQIILYVKLKIMTLNLDLSKKLENERNNLGRIIVK